MQIPDELSDEELLALVENIELVDIDDDTRARIWLNVQLDILARKPEFLRALQWEIDD